MSKSLKFAVLIFLILTRSVFALVEPPNYDFSVDKFQEFMPGKTLAKNHQKNIEFNKKGFKTYKIYIEHIRYKFPLFVQTKDEVITDFFARLPAYFLHDVFHQSKIQPTL